MTDPRPEMPRGGWIPDMATRAETPQAITYWPVELLLRHRLTKGSILRGRLGRQSYVYLLGARANALIFAHDAWFSVGEAYAGLIPVDGPTSVVVSDGADHTRRRGVLRPILAPRQIRTYLSAISESAIEAVQQIRPREPFDAYQLFRRAIRRSTLRALFGPNMATDAEWLGERLQPLLDLVDGVPQLVALEERRNSKTWKAAMAARSELDGYIYQQIAAARAGAGDPESVLFHLVGDGPEGCLSDLEVRDQAVTLIAAGYETTSAAMGWAVHNLATHPEWQGRARDEVDDVLGDGAIQDAGQLRALPTVSAIIAETLRLYPPATIAARRVEQDFAFDGRHVQVGDTVIFSPYVTHRDPALYPHPREFRPQRWLAGPSRPPEEYLPFGGGAHRCIGSHLATVELTVMLSQLVRRGGFELVGNRPRARGFAAMRPHGGVPIAFGADGQ